MIVRNFGLTSFDGVRATSALVSWEDQAFPDQELFFEITEGKDNASASGEEAWADAFLAACFPLAAVHGEARLRIDGQPCPMLVEGLYAAHAWWQSWGGMPHPPPSIEINPKRQARPPAQWRRGVAFLSGGVDGLHLLMRNHRLYDRGDPAFIREALFIHGFDIGKRADDPEDQRFQRAFESLQPVAAEAGVRLIRCRTNLRHLPSKPDFWYTRHNGAALASVGHAAIVGSAFLFIGASHDIANPVPIGSHPAVDGLFSSQRVTVIHEGARYSRFRKVQELVSWPTALAALRVCPAKPASNANCGRCEKCLRTRLELLAAGVDYTAAFGASLTPTELWEELGDVGDRAITYEDLLGPLRLRGLHELCRILEGKIQVYRARGGVRKNLPADGNPVDIRPLLASGGRAVRRNGEMFGITENDTFDQHPWTVGNRE